MSPEATAAPVASLSDDQALILNHIVQPVLDDLKVRAADRQELLAFLDLVVPIVPLGERLYGNAYAYHSGAEKVISLDLSYVQACAGYASLAGYLAFWNTDSDDGVRRFLASREQKVRGAGAHSEDVHGDFDPATIVTDTVVLEAIHQLRGLTSWDVVVWTTLHEIGHHALGHWGAVDLEASRKRELAADAWAFDAMRALGYSLYYVERFLASRQLYERVQIAVGALPQESESTHPSFATRRLQLVSLHPDYLAAPAAYGSVLMLEAPASGIFNFVPPDAAEGEGPHVVGVGGPKGISAYAGIRKGRTLTLFRKVEATGQRDEVTFDGLDRCVVNVTLVSKDAAGRILAQYPSRAFFRAATAASSLKVQGRKLGDLLEPKRAKDRRLLAAGGAKEPALSAAEAILHAWNEGFGALVYRLQTTNWTYAEFDATVQAEKKKNLETLRHILGDEVLAGYVRATQAETTSQIAARYLNSDNPREEEKRMLLEELH